MRTLGRDNSDRRGQSLVGINEVAKKLLLNQTCDNCYFHDTEFSDDPEFRMWACQVAESKLDIVNLDNRTCEKWKLMQ